MRQPTIAAPLAMALAAAVLAAPVAGMTAETVRRGAEAFGDWHGDAPGVWRKITASDLPSVDSNSPRNNARVVAAPAGAMPKTLPGFEVTAFAKLEGPRQIKLAPNGDLFVTESQKGQIRVLRAKPGARTAETTEVFVTGLERPFGMAFYPAANPKWLYVANTNSIVRIPYRAGDLKASGPPEVLIPTLVSTGGHYTRDIAFTPDGKRMLVSIGSASNIGEKMSVKTPAEIAAWEAEHGTGAAWDGDTGRAQVTSFNPEGKDRRAYGTGIRNCVGLTIQPATGAPWCTTNERDLLGDNLVPDYVTRVKAGGFYGWPWFYIGAHRDVRKEPRPDLAGKVIVPDVLLQPHSAALQTVFYPQAPGGSAAFPSEYGGQAFTALHGSWNRSARTGYKVVRLKLRNGNATGEYEDFLTGFVVDDQSVWGRPVGVAVAADGALIVSEDGNGTVWRVAPAGK
jgi:glucose/arabinose dehydrogenase